MKRKKISVCMATYNGEKYIFEQIKSILKQLDEYDELIISDDGSSDNTLEIVKKINDSRIRLLINNEHCYAANFENALRNATGELIFLADQDDIWCDNKVEVCVKALEKYDFVVSNATVVNEKLEVIIDSRNDKLKIRKGFINNIVKTYYLGCCMAFRKNVLNACLPLPTNRDLCSHDAWITMVSELFFKTYICPEKLILYRRHGGNVSSGAMGITNSISRMIKIRGYLIIQLVKRAASIKKYID